MEIEMRRLTSNFAEDYVSKDSIHKVHDCRGHLKMYEKCGFYIFAEQEGKVVVRKALR